MGRRIVTENVMGTPEAVKTYENFEEQETMSAPPADMPDGAGKAANIILPNSTAAAAVGSTPPKTAEEFDDYMSMLIKYIPTEIVALYLFIDGILKSFDSSAVVGWVVFFLLLALTPVYIWRMTRIRSKPLAWDQIIVSFFSFALWVYAIGGPFTGLSWYAPQYGSILVAIFTVVVPLFKSSAVKAKASGNA